ncbi:MAG TPA: oligopeptide transporter, OPT family [Spirochaetota bacterium]|nr:oligopeptide transporter, OPT family [Spirochaetota bacterium]
MRPNEDTGPYIPPETTLPEITLKGVLLGVVLAVVLAGANSYLGLFAGLTVSAAIPAAVVSMAVLGLFKRSNILENNAVQTAASAGEALACGAIFTMPALVLMGYWNTFDYWETTFIAASGGVLGVLFTIPLRRTLIVEQKLTFPEGLATAEVLKTGARGGSSIRQLLLASIAGGLFKLFGSGFSIWKETAVAAALAGGKVFIYFGVNLSPALLSVGYIVGMNIAVLIFIGGAISWWIGIPLYIAINGAPADVTAFDLGHLIWSTKIRFLGVGAMVVGGLWALVSLRQSITSVFSDSWKAFRFGGSSSEKSRTERDTPLQWVLLGIAVMIVPVFIIYLKEMHSISLTTFMSVLMVFAGFLFSAVGGYMAGLVGSSNNPVSGVTVATVLCSALLLAALAGTGAAVGPASAVLIGAVVACAAAIAGDNMQDLKAGYVLGSTPWKLQIMQITGVLASALVIGPVLNLLNAAYGFGPRSALHPQSLPAPQATLMQSVAEGVFGGNLPWNIIATGAVIGVACIIADLLLKKSGSSFRAPVLAVAVGLYLPFELDVVIMLGGLVALLAQRMKNRDTAGGKSGILAASGFITGEAVMGIVLAIPVALSGKSNVLHLIREPIGAWPGVALFVMIGFWLWSRGGTKD